MDVCSVLFQSIHNISDSVSADWNKLVGAYVRGIHYNDLALKHARSGDFVSAARVWLRASRSCFCDVKILFNLAICYQNGLGLTKDVGKVISWESFAILVRSLHCFKANNVTNVCSYALQLTLSLGKQ